MTTTAPAPAAPICGIRSHRHGRAVGLVLVCRGHVLLGERSEHVDNPGTWCTVGGSVDPGERSVDAALREAWEEVGLPRDAVFVIGTVPGIRCRCGWRFTAVIARMVRDVVLVPNWEADQLAWIPVDQVADLPLHPGLAAGWNHNLGAIAAEHA